MIRLIILLSGLLLIAACASNGQQPPPDFRINVAQQELGAPSELMQAVAEGNEEALRTSLLAGDSVNAVYQGETPLRIALQEGRGRFVRILLRAGAVPNWNLQPDQASLLMLASRKGMNTEVVEFIQQGQDINYANRQGWSALAEAALNGHLTTANILIDAGADVDVYPDGESLLMRLVADNNMLIVKPMLEAGADVNFVSDSGRSA
jgi:ankyrin repeat protein